MARRTAHQPILERLTYAVGVVTVVLIFSYAYFVIGTIIEIVLREDYELAIKAKSSSLATLEAEYLKAQEKVTLEFASTLGFHPIDAEEYVTKGLSRATENYQAFNR
jgi:hypothetical protein